jgi:pyrroline-5-carboxylate reductase
VERQKYNPIGKNRKTCAIEITMLITSTLPFGDLLMNRIGFCGAGQMATALAAGFVSSGIIDGSSISAYDPSAMAREKFSTAVGAAHLIDEASQLAECDLVFIAVKPHFLSAACQPLENCLSSKHLLISIVAGASLNRLAGLLGECRWIRVMPNTPCMVQMGACGVAAGPSATEQDVAQVKQLLESVSHAHVVPETLLDAVTGLSGSGPAFVYQMIEALSDGGVLMGLPRAIATELAAQTLKGAAEMVLKTGLHPGELKDRVASPGGTTIAGLEALENHGLRAALIEAVRAAAERSKQLGAENA